MTDVAPSDSLREIYERRGGEEYALPVVPDPELDRKFAVLVEEIGALLPVGSYLDAGCGDGRFLAALPAVGPVPDRIVGVDIADSILATARLAVAAVAVDAELVRGNLERLPLADSDFELVVSIQVVEHLLDPEAGIRELARVLRPGGRLLLSTDNRWNLLTRTLNAPRWTLAALVRRRNSRVRLRFPHRTFSRRQVYRLLRDAGFAVERSRTFRFTMVGSSPRLRRRFARIDRRLPDIGVGDILLVVAHLPEDGGADEATL